MRKYIVNLTIWLIILLCLILADQYFDKRKSIMEETITAYVAKDIIPYGTKLLESSFKKIDINKSEYDGEMLSQFKDGYSSQTITRGQVLTAEILTLDPPVIIREDQRLITIKCSIVEANGWQFENGDLVDLVIIANNDTKIVLKNLKVFQVFGGLDDSILKEYVSLIASESDAYTYYQNLRESQLYIAIKSIVK